MEREDHAYECCGSAWGPIEYSQKNNNGCFMLLGLGILTQLCPQTENHSHKLCQEKNQKYDQILKQALQDVANHESGLNFYKAESLELKNQLEELRKEKASLIIEKSEQQELVKEAQKKINELTAQLEEASKAKKTADDEFNRRNQEHEQAIKALHEKHEAVLADHKKDLISVLQAFGLNADLDTFMPVQEESYWQKLIRLAKSSDT